ncbi:MAG: hypothetical protein ACI9KN_000583 [Gammaproteobacteria bacterium]
MTEPVSLAQSVLRFCDIDSSELMNLLARYQLEVRITPPLEVIPGSFWGDEEAGLIGGSLYLRSDTPIHSVLHEAGHFICMDGSRRKQLDTNAGNNQQEENAVCYLQILLAIDLPSMGRQRMLSDMDAWGYSFRLGCARDWFEQDAADARDWLLNQGLIDDNNQPNYVLR